MAEPYRVTIKKILFLQAMVAITVSTGYLFLGTVNQAVSAILGGFTAFLPNLYLAYRMLSVSNHSAQKIVTTLYRGESHKFLLTCLLFTIDLSLPSVQFFPLMLCFVSVLSVFWFALKLEI